MTIIDKDVAAEWHNVTQRVGVENLATQCGKLADVINAHCQDNGITNNGHRTVVVSTAMMASLGDAPPALQLANLANMFDTLADTYKNDPGVQTYLAAKMMEMLKL